MEPSLFNYGVLGTYVSDITYFDNGQKIALIGPFYGFQQNPTQAVNHVAWCSSDGKQCSGLGQGITDLYSWAEIVAYGNYLYALYSGDNYATVSCFDYTNFTTSTEWQTIYTAAASGYYWSSLEVYQDSVWLFGTVFTPDNQTVAAARWNLTENSWEYAYGSTVPSESSQRSPSSTVSPDGQNIYLVYTNQVYRWNETDWELFFATDCENTPVLASTNDGLLVGCNSSVFYVKEPQQATILPNFECEGWWVELKVSPDNSTLYGLCQIYLHLESYSYSFEEAAVQSQSEISELQSLELQLGSMCVYGSKMFISGVFDQVNNVAALGTAIWNTDKGNWMAVLEDSVQQCCCATDRDTMAAICLQPRTSAEDNYPILIIDSAQSDLGYGQYANVQQYLLTQLADTVYLHDIEIVGNQIYLAVNGLQNISLSKWTEEDQQVNIVLTAGSWDFKFEILENTAYLVGDFRPSYNDTDQLTAARFDLLNNTWLPMDQVAQIENSSVLTGSVLCVEQWNSTGQIYIGGTFNRIGDVKVSNWGGYNTSGQAVDSVSGGVPDPVVKMAPLGDRMYMLVSSAECRSVFQPDCNELLYYDSIGKTYSYTIAFGVSSIAAGSDDVADQDSSSNSPNATTIEIIVIVSVTVVLVSAMIMFIVFRKMAKRNNYQEIPDRHLESAVSLPIDFQHTQFVMKSVLGRGAYGTVWSCVLPDHAGATYAVKQILLSKGETQKIAIVKQEIELLEKLRHPHIVHYCGSRIETTDTSVEFFIFMELYEQPCSLKGVIQKALNKNKGSYKLFFTYAEVKNFLFQIADGLNYLHSQGIAHRDLKCANILIRAKGSVVNSLHIADFGIAKAMSVEGGANLLASTMLGTPSFMAPEVLKNKRYDPFKADIWSFGMLMYEMLAWKEPDTPGKKPSLPEDIVQFMKGDDRFQNVIEIFDKCTEEDPNRRPSASDLLFLCENLP